GSSNATVGGGNQNDTFTDSTWVVWDAHGQQPMLYDTQQNTLPLPAEHIALSGAYELTLNGQTVICHPVFEWLQREVQHCHPDFVAAETGVVSKALKQAAQLLSQSQATAYHSWSGVAQSDNPTETDRTIAILYAL